MILKRGVILDGLRHEMFLAIGWIGSAYAQYGYPLILTSCKDSTHRTGSLHYSGYAIDCRTKHLSGEAKHKILAFCRAKLDPQGYDTILEAEGTANEHFHCEFDPKPGERLWRREGETGGSAITADLWGEA